MNIHLATVAGRAQVQPELRPLPGAKSPCMSTLLAAVVQMNSKPDLAHNLEQAARLVRGAALQGAKLIVLPECFAWTGPEGTQRAVAESLPEGGPVLARCQSWARELGVELI